MTNINKINPSQKIKLAEFMTEHPNLAKNIIPNCAQGKSTAERLWAELAIKLNAVGPPVKDGKLWRKVYADQKYQAKKKLSFNKAAKRKTGGGAYEEKFITNVEEQLIEASGLEVAVEGLTKVLTFGQPPALRNSITHVAEEMEDEVMYTFPSSSENNTTNKENITLNISKKPKESTFVDTKTALLQENLKAGIEFKKEISFKLDRLITIQEKFLRLKEEEHQMNMAVMAVDLQIKTLKLDILKS